MSDNENAKPAKPVYAVYTDDSGVVISQKQYAELHGEAREPGRQYYDGARQHNSARKKKQKPNVESLNETQSNTKNEVVSERAKLVICSICKVQVKTKNYQKHIAKAHSKTQALQATKKKINSVRSGSREKCPFCHSVMPLNLLAKHIYENHPSIDLETVEILNGRYRYELSECPLCSEKMNYKILFSHIESKHQEKNPKIVMADFNRRVRKKQEIAKTEKELNSLVSEYEKLKQSHDETRDAGKYMGFMKRENGKFGSLPLHDNYSDESDAE